MRWSFKIARIGGIDVRIHVTFLILLAVLASYYGAQGGAGGALKVMIFFLLVFLCVLLHEFGHAFAAKAYGIKTADITLLPIGGVARMERMPEKPAQELVVAIAGPLVNVVIAAGLITLKQLDDCLEIVSAAAGQIVYFTGSHFSGLFVGYCPHRVFNHFIGQGLH